MFGKFEFKKLREFGEIIGDTFVFIRENIKPLLKVFLYFCGIFILVGAVAAVLYQLDVEKAGFMNSNRTNAFASSRIFTWNYFIVLVFSMISYTGINVSILSFIALYIEKGRIAPNIEEVWAYFRYYFFRVFGSSLIVVVFFIFCFAACLFPGIYVFPAMSLIFPVMIFENAGLNYSFGRSFKLLKDQWWVTAATILVVYIITYACMSVVILPTTIIALSSAFTQGSMALSTAMIVITTILQYVCQIFLIIPTVALSLCYFNLVERKENTGLMSRIDQFGQVNNPFQRPEEY